MNKKVSVLIVLSFLLILVLGAAYSYSKYSASVSGSASADVAKWNITVNGCNIVNPDKQNSACFEEVVDEENNIVTVTRNFGINEFTYDNKGSKDVVDNKIAPGSSGTFKIRIKPNDTQVSIKYKLNVALAKENDSITVYRSAPNGNTRETVMELDGYEGYIYYNPDGFSYMNGNTETKTDEIVFTIFVDWAAEVNNVVDTEFGTSSTSPVLEIPVEIVFEQYLG